MNLDALRNILPMIGRPSSMLICELDGFSLRGAVFARAENGLRVEASAVSSQPDLAMAVAEMITALRTQGWQGNRAVLISPAVFTNLIELPIPVKKARNPIQMQEMVRWELDPLMIQHNGMWTAGQLLHALGHMDTSQIQEVLERQRGKNKAPSTAGGYAFKRYCELAIEMGYITQAQADECLRWQAWLRTDSDEISCGWLGQQPSAPVEGLPEPSSGSYSWLVSGVNTEVMRHWEAAFKQQQVQLTELYPLTGASAEMMSEAARAILLEQHTHYSSVVRIEHGAVAAVMTHSHTGVNEVDALVDGYHAVHAPEIEQIYFAGAKAESKSTAETVQSIIARDITLHENLSEGTTICMQGIARSVLLEGKPRYCVPVSVQGPKPPIWKNGEARAIAAAVLLVGIVIVLEIFVQVRYSIAESRHAKISQEKRTLDSAIAQVQAQIDAVKKIKDELKAKQAELDKVNKRYEFFALELPARTVVVKSLLEALAVHVNEDVVINVLEETPNMGIRLEGWALSEAAGQRFIQSYNEAIKPLGYEVVQPLVRSQPGRLGMLGYGVTFRLMESDQVLTDDMAGQ